MTVYFQTTETLHSITARYPETIAVFTSNGFPQMADAVAREQFGKMITLDAALTMKNLNQQTFTSLLATAIRAERGSSDATLVKSEKKDQSALHVVGLLPCPVRLPLIEQFTRFTEKSDLPAVDAELKAASIGTEWVTENLTTVTSADDLPDLFISAGFDLFFDREKIGRFRSRGVFADLVNTSRENPLFRGRGLRDPSGNYSVISVVPAIFVVNTEELHGRAIPRSWAELLQPEWERSISLPIGDFDLFNAILLNIHHRHGDEGLKKLGRALGTAMHPAQMIKSIQIKQNRPAVTIMPWFFSRTIQQQSTTEAVWPDDGAILSPIFMLAKKERAQELQPIVDFFASKAVGETLSHQGLFPSLHPDVDNNLAADAPMMWLGWDNILNTDLSAWIAECEELFNAATRGGEPA